MEAFTKEVLMMWKVLVVEGGRCIALKAGKKGTVMRFLDLRPNVKKSFPDGIDFVFFVVLI